MGKSVNSMRSDLMRTGAGRSGAMGAWVLAAMLVGGAARGQAVGGTMDAGINVQGTGEAKARPTQVEIGATLSGEAELATDATVKFRDAKKRALAAIAAMKNPDLSVVSQGVAINSAMDANTQMMMMRGQNVTPTSQKVQVMESSRIVLKNADKLEPEALLDLVLKILDAAKDGGFVVGPPPASNSYEYQVRMSQGQGNTVAVFKLPDSGALRDEAFKSAIEDAKAKAQKLADLSGVKLGRIVAITQSDSSRGDSSLPTVIRAIYGGNGRSEPQESGVMGTTSGDLTVKVTLSVQFEIAK